MAEYIERKAAIDYIKQNQCRRCSDIGLCGGCAVLTAIRLFEKVPAEDVVSPTYGEWIEDDYGYNRCSACGFEEDEPERVTPYCPSCGAKMDEEDGDGNDEAIL